MPTRAIALTATVVVLAAGLAVPALASNYRAPVGGKWKVQNTFDYTAGGSVQLSKDGKKVTKLSVNVGEGNQGERYCGTAKRLAITKSLNIKRVGSYKRPVVGRLGKDKLITTISTTVKVDGVAKPGKVAVVFEMDGKSAFSNELTVGTCKLTFAIRKAK